MKKGFVHMLEAILVSLLVIIVVPTLLYSFGIPSEWDKAGLIFIGEDSLVVLDKIGSGESFLQEIMEKNISQIGDKFNKILGISARKLSYNIKTVGSLKNVVRVGFNCTTCNPETEKRNIEEILTPAYVNDRKIIFTVFPFSYEEFSKYNIDVIFINDHDEMESANNNFISMNDKITPHLEKGKGIVEFIDLNGPDYNLDIEEDVFGLKPGVSSGDSLNFTNSDNPEKINYDIQKYFYGVGSYLNLEGDTDWILWEGVAPDAYLVKYNDTKWIDESKDSVDVDTDADGIYDKFGLEEGDSFTMTGGVPTNYEISIDKIINKTSKKEVYFNFIDKPYKFSDFTSSPGTYPEDGNVDRIVLRCEGERNPAVIINSTEFRAVWIERPSGIIGDDIKGLVKSSVLWASEKEWWNFLRTVSGETIKVDYFISQGEEFHESYWVELTLWYLY